MDKALQALLSLHPSGSAREVQAGDRSKAWRMVNGFLDVERGGRQNVQKIGGRK